MLIPEIPDQFIKELADAYELDEFVVINILDKSFDWIRATFPRREIGEAFYHEANKKCGHVHNAGWSEPCLRTDKIIKSKGWRILARHKWVEGAIITESCTQDSARKRFTATILGFRGWKLWEGEYGEAQGMVEKICAKVRELVNRVEANEDAVFTEKISIS